MSFLLLPMLHFVFFRSSFLCFLEPVLEKLVCYSIRMVSIHHCVLKIWISISKFKRKGFVNLVVLKMSQVLYCMNSDIHGFTYRTFIKTAPWIDDLFVYKFIFVWMFINFSSKSISSSENLITNTAFLISSARDVWVFDTVVLESYEFEISASF